MKNSKVRLMKRKSFIVKFAIITTIIIVIVLAYNFPESMINIIQLQARSGQEYDISQSVEMIELKGESYISDSQLHSDEMTRAAAIVDAISRGDCAAAEAAARLHIAHAHKTRLQQI